MLLQKRMPTRKLKEEHIESNKTIVLDDKVDEFIDWYFENMVKEHYTDIGENHLPTVMRNFIEKMAVWYELRYSNSEVNRLIGESNSESSEENLDRELLARDKFYDTKAFLDTLSFKEKCLFQNPEIYIDSNHKSAYVILTSNGIVEQAEGVEEYTHFKIKDEDLQGLHINKIIQMLQEKGVVLPSKHELEAAINKAAKQIYQKEEMLNCVMYRIIERGGNRVGPRRAFLFAKEFGRNIDIPMIYGVDNSDPELRKFMNEYIKAGGSKELVCYVNYFSRAKKYDKRDTVTIQELIQTTTNDYTEEETALHQRMVNVLANQINTEETTKGKVKQLSLKNNM